MEGTCFLFLFFKSRTQFENRQAIFVRCDVTIWDDQVSMFETAISKYGSVDIVVNMIHPLLHDPYSQSCASGMSLIGKVLLGSQRRCR